MRLKLDENLGRTAATRCRAAGHDVSTVIEERLAGATDDRLYDECRATRRILVTLDLDFADPRHFPPGHTPGLVVLRLREPPTQRELLATLDRLLVVLERHEVAGRLWVVRENRVRQYQPE